MDQYIGRFLDDRYEILEIIGTGGMAVVYKARCHRLNRLVAIKILKDEFAQDEEFRRRFRAEGEAVAMLSHPNIVQVYDVSSTLSANYIVMELIDGISLKQYMEKKGVLNWKETLHFAMQIAKGLEHAHSRGIIHRDIKPHNVMVLKNGSVKVMDFGIARVMSKSNTLTKEALGSVHYISPEQAKGGHTDNRSDIYSLGVVMYEMMTGRPPYDGESPVAVAIQHINGGAAAPSSLNPNIPKGLEQIIMKSMSLEIKDRYVSATEMLQDMEEFRKNPEIVFAYHTIVDDATRTIPTIPIINQRMTTADKKVQARTGQAPERSSEGARPRTAAQGSQIRHSTGQSAAVRNNDAPQRAQQRRKNQQIQQQRQQREERSRVATTAVVVCSAVAIIAIVIFLIALFNGVLLNQQKELVEVPYLIGDMYSEDMQDKYSDFTIRLQPGQYDDVYIKGQIMHQEPAGGSQVVVGSDLVITVSLGEEPETAVMENFTGSDGEETKTLLSGQGYIPVTKQEASYVYEAGVVIRTEPSAGSELTPGQTVYLIVSTGPDIITAKMPNVLGLEVSRAKEILEQGGFTNVTTEEVESLKPKGEVIFQSVQKNEEVDVTTQITLQVSKGPEETEPSTEDPWTEPEPEKVRVNFDLPEREEPYVLSIFQDGKEVVEAQEVQPGITSFICNLTGVGTVTYDLYIDGEYYTSVEVEYTR